MQTLSVSNLLDRALSLPQVTELFDSKVLLNTFISSLEVQKPAKAPQRSVHESEHIELSHYLRDQIKQYCRNGKANNILDNEQELALAVRTAKSLKLTKLDRKLFKLVWLIKHNEPLSLLSSHLEFESKLELFEFLGNLLEQDTFKVAKAFEANARLLSNGFLELTDSPSASIDDIKLLPACNAKLNTNNHSYLGAGTPIERDLDIIDLCFNSETKHIRAIRSLLQNKPNAKLLVTGLPNSGRSTFANYLASKFFNGSINIPSNLELEKRLAAITLIEKLKAKQKNKELLLIDNASDMFNFTLSSVLSSDHPRSEESAAEFINSMNHPSIWVTDKAQPFLLSQFDYVIEMNLPNEEKLLDYFMEKHPVLAESEAWLNQIINHEGITIGMLNQVFENVSVSTLSGRAFRFHALYLLNQQLRSQDFKTIKIARHNNDPDTFNTNWVNSNFDLDRILNALNNSAKLKVIIHGIPGTGKTAYAEHLSTQLGRPLYRISPADVINKYIGESEKNIRKTFQKASSDNAILFIDEIDSLTSSRESEDNSWRISVVNQILQEIDSFDGTLIAATNLLNIIDKAVLRRFDLKMEFKAPEKQHIRSMLVSYADSLGLNQEKLISHPSFETIDNLTPAICKNVSSRFKLFNEEPSVDSFYKEIKEESAYLFDHQSRPIGFL